MTEDEFWTRYFFRVHQVEREEARRKAIIQGERADVMGRWNNADATVAA